MSFIMTKEARSFFHNITSPHKFLMFDAFYCCLMVGLDARKVEDASALDADPFIAGYPDDFKARGDIVAGLLIDAELDRKDIAAEDKISIEREMIRLVDPTSPTRLSVDGDKLLNLYAASGFAILKDHMMPPGSIEEFLVAYHRYWHPDDGVNGSESPR